MRLGLLCNWAVLFQWNILSWQVEIMAVHLMTSLLTLTHITKFTEFNEFDNDSDETGRTKRIWVFNTLTDPGNTYGNMLCTLTLSPAISRIFLSTDIHWFPLSPDMANTSWFWFLRVTWRVWMKNVVNFAVPAYVKYKICESIFF